MEISELREGIVVGVLKGSQPYVETKYLISEFESEKVYLPVKLTESWLIKLGFEKFARDTYALWMTDLKFYIKLEDDLGDNYEYHLSVEDYNENEEEERTDNFMYLVRVEYVHHLQNIIHDLTYHEHEKEGLSPAISPKTIFKFFQLDAKEKAEELYTYYDDLLSRELQLNILVKDGEITGFVKDCARKVCNEMISKEGSLTETNYWYDVRKLIEENY